MSVGVSLVGDQIKDSYGGVLHVQNSLDVENDNTGYDIANRPNGSYLIYDGNGVPLPLSFVDGSLVVNSITITNPPAPVKLLPARKTVVYTTTSRVLARSTALFAIDLGYASISLRKVSTNFGSVIRLYPSENLANLDTRMNVTDLTLIPPSNCGLINQVSTVTALDVWVSGQSVGMTDDGSGIFYALISNFATRAAAITITFDFLALEAATTQISLPST